MISLPVETISTKSTMFSTAIVTNNSDPDNLGRIKVKYPWSSKSDESYWARLSTLMAGDEQGFYFVPEVEQEVLVLFINGDINYPVIIGALWNQHSLPPANNKDGKNNIRKIRSRSGHEIIFDDDEGSAAKLEIKSSSGHTIVLDDASGSEKISITDKAGSSIEFDTTSKAISIVSDMEISIKATKITIDASGELVLKGAMVRIN
jgi:uncharacterized protein involved in type VI secretion and phage assembly